MTIDFHSHLLPGIDDGAKDINISKGIISKELHDNVNVIVATPHYYCEQKSVNDFIADRNNAYSKIVNEYNLMDIKIPKIILAAEVYYSHFLNNVSNIHDLCIEGTDYLLLELPYREITSSTVNSILNFADNNNISLVIAHIERYLQFTSYKSIVSLLSSGVLGQINCGSVIERSSRKKVFKFIKDGYVHVIGSDVHNITSRPAYMAESLEILSQKFSPAFTTSLMNNALRILNNEDIENIY